MHKEKQIALNKMLLSLILLQLIIYKIMLTFRKGCNALPKTYFKVYLLFFRELITWNY